MVDNTDLVHYDIQHESLHSERHPLLLLLLGSRTETYLLPNKTNSQNNKLGIDIVDMEYWSVTKL